MRVHGATFCTKVLVNGRRRPGRRWRPARRRSGAGEQKRRRQGDRDRGLGGGARWRRVVPRRDGRLDERREAQDDRDPDHAHDVPREVCAAPDDARRHLSKEPRVSMLELSGEPGLRGRLGEEGRVEIACGRPVSRGGRGRGRRPVWSRFGWRTGPGQLGWRHVRLRRGDSRHYRRRVRFVGNRCWGGNSRFRQRRKRRWSRLRGRRGGRSSHLGVYRGPVGGMRRDLLVEREGSRARTHFPLLRAASTSLLAHHFAFSLSPRSVGSAQHRAERRPHQGVRDRRV